MVASREGVELPSKGLSIRIIDDVDERSPRMLTLDGIALYYCSDHQMLLVCASIDDYLM